jgi:glutamine synthetase
MRPNSGMLSRADLTAQINRGEIETVLLVFPDWYGRLMGKRITGTFFLDHAAEEGIHACDYLLACDMEMTPVPGYKFTSWESGYGDFQCLPDFSTARRASWLPQTALVIGDLFRNNAAVEVSPRRILQKQLQEAQKMGFAVMGGSELELYIFKETYETAAAKNYHHLNSAGSYIEDYHIFQGTKEEELVGAIRRELNASGVPVETSKGEWGPGQQEINLEYCEALAQADRNVIYKHAAKEIAYAQGKAVTFMAKWDEKFAGSSMHIHLSLWNPEVQQNLFHGNENLGPLKVSELFRCFLGGWMKHAREFTAFYAPNVSSYKRYQSGSFAPTGIAWSYDNRTAGFRVVGHDQSLRIECRIPGADANPYIVYAAILASGLEGIRKKIDPPPIFQGDIYQAKDFPRVPSTLRDAITELEKSSLASQALGSEIVDHYLHFLRTEQSKFDEVVTCWERARYFERA